MATKKPETTKEQLRRLGILSLKSDTSVEASPVPARENYQRMATRCLRAAERLHDPAERCKLLEVAGGYMALARHVAERHDHGTAHRGSEHDERRPADA